MKIKVMDIHLKKTCHMLQNITYSFKKKQQNNLITSYKCGIQPLSLVSFNKWLRQRCGGKPSNSVSHG